MRYATKGMPDVYIENSGTSKLVRGMQSRHYCPFPRPESTSTGISSGRGSGIPHNCTPCAHAITSSPLGASPTEDASARDGVRRSSDTPARTRRRYEGASGSGMRTRRQTSTSRPASGCSADLRSLTEEEDEDRECREGAVYFSVGGGLKAVGGGEVP